MLLAPRSFVDFIDGRYGNVQPIAFVPGEYTRGIGSLSSELLIRRDYAIKLKEKHGLRYEQLQLIQPAIDLGYAKQVGKDLEFLFYDDSDPGLPYLLVVKAVRRSEIWLRTFYRTERWKELLFFERKGTLLREHVGLE